VAKTKLKGLQTAAVCYLLVICAAPLTATDFLSLCCHSVSIFTLIWQQ